MFYQLSEHPFAQSGWPIKVPSQEVSWKLPLLSSTQTEVTGEKKENVDFYSRQTSIFTA